MDTSYVELKGPQTRQVREEKSKLSSSTLMFFCLLFSLNDKTVLQLVIVINLENPKNLFT